MKEVHTTVLSAHHKKNFMGKRQEIKILLELAVLLETDKAIKQSYTKIGKYIAEPSVRNHINLAIEFDRLTDLPQNSIVSDIIKTFFEQLGTDVYKSSSVAEITGLLTTKGNKSFTDRAAESLQDKTAASLRHKIYAVFAIRFFQGNRTVQNELLQAAEKFSQTNIAKKIGFTTREVNAFLGSISNEKTQIKNKNFGDVLRKASKEIDPIKRANLIQVGFNLLKEKIAELGPQSGTQIDFLELNELLKTVKHLKIEIFDDKEIAEGVENLEKEILKMRGDIAGNFLLSTITDLQETCRQNTGMWNRFKLVVSNALSSNPRPRLSPEQLIEYAAAIETLNELLDGEGRVKDIPACIETIQSMMSAEIHPAMSKKLTELNASLSRAQLISGLSTEKRDNIALQTTFKSLYLKLYQLEQKLPSSLADVALTLQSCLRKLDGVIDNPSIKPEKVKTILNEVLKGIKDTQTKLPKKHNASIERIEAECRYLLQAISTTEIDQQFKIKKDAAVPEEKVSAKSQAIETLKSAAVALTSSAASQVEVALKEMVEFLKPKLAQLEAELGSSLSQLMSSLSSAQSALQNYQEKLNNFDRESLGEQGKIIADIFKVVAQIASELSQDWVDDHVSFGLIKRIQEKVDVVVTQIETLGSAAIELTSGAASSAADAVASAASAAEAVSGAAGAIKGAAKAAAASGTVQLLEKLRFRIDQPSPPAPASNNPEKLPSQDAEEASSFSSK